MVIRMAVAMSLSVRSYAKINLHLEVLGRRPDGFHELTTVFQTVDLHDRLDVELTDAGVSLEILEGDAPAGRDNLVVRAAEAYLERWGVGGARLGLHKRIPMGGGLGGGSSNAATTLLALDKLLGNPASAQQLAELGRGLGADVPFFLAGGRALGTGRGDEISLLEDSRGMPLWLLTPPVHVATAEVFSALGELTDRATVSSMEQLKGVSMASGSGGPPGRNDLQDLVARRYPPVRQVCDAVMDAGVGWVLMSGSGGTVFCPRPDSTHASVIRARLPAGTKVFDCRTLSRSELLNNWILD